VKQLDNHHVKIALYAGTGKNGKPSLVLYFDRELKPGRLSCEDSAYASNRISGVVRVARKAKRHPPDAALPFRAPSG